MQTGFSFEEKWKSMQSKRSGEGRKEEAGRTMKSQKDSSVLIADENSAIEELLRATVTPIVVKVIRKEESMSAIFVEKSFSVQTTSAAI